MLAIHVQAPTAHTFLELVYVRWGPTTHKLFFAIGILDNLLVSVAMMQGAVVTLNVLTGVNAYAVCFIIPAGIAVYVLVGAPCQKALNCFDALLTALRFLEH